MNPIDILRWWMLWAYAIHEPQTEAGKKEIEALITATRLAIKTSEGVNQ